MKSRCINPRLFHQIQPDNPPLPCLCLRHNQLNPGKPLAPKAVRQHSAACNTAPLSSGLVLLMHTTTNHPEQAPVADCPQLGERDRTPHPEAHGSCCRDRAYASRACVSRSLSDALRRSSAGSDRRRPADPAAGCIVYSGPLLVQPPPPPTSSSTPGPRQPPLLAPITTAPSVATRRSASVRTAPPFCVGICCGGPCMPGPCTTTGRVGSPHRQPLCLLHHRHLNAHPTITTT